MKKLSELSKKSDILPCTIVDVVDEALVVAKK
jgi:hypothetical protein